MAAVLDAVMVELRGGPISPGNTAVSARKASTLIDTERGSAKRRQTDRTKQPGANSMPPPQAPLHSRRIPDHDAQHSIVQQAHRQPNPGDYVVVTPQSDAPPWPNLPSGGDLARQQPNLVFPATDLASMNPLDRRQEWVNHVGAEFPHMAHVPTMAGLPDDMGNFGFLPLPSEEDWNRWHDISSADASTDLDGFPPRGRLPSNFGHPP